jgi:hypothetical protein
MAAYFDLESLVFIEQRHIFFLFYRNLPNHRKHSFYDAGFADGYAHGRIHGLIEGRALGREKGFEMWEELGFYEGFAKGWKAILETFGNNSNEYRNPFPSSVCVVKHSPRRAIQHIRQLLDLIGQFPRVNPSSSSSSTNTDVDIQKLQRQIRSRYKALCSALSVRPRVRVATSSVPELEQEESDVTDLPEMGGGEIMSQNNRVAPGSSIPVWKIDKKTGSKSAVTNMDLSF